MVARVNCVVARATPPGAADVDAADVEGLETEPGRDHEPLRDAVPAADHGHLVVRPIASKRERDRQCRGQVTPSSPPAINVRTIRRPLPSTLGGDVEQNAHAHEGGRQRGATVADEGQRDARCGDDSGHRHHVDERLHADPRRDASREQGAESVGRPKRGAHTAPRKEQERPEHSDGSDQSELLADDGEDEVGVGLGQPLVLLDRVAEPDAEDPARAECVERLAVLESRSRARRRRG